MSADLSHKYTQLANDSIGAAATSTNPEVAMRLREVVQSLGGACIDLVQSSGQCQIRQDEQTLREIGECSRAVSEKVGTCKSIKYHKYGNFLKRCLHVEINVKIVVCRIPSTVHNS